jgi:hypothetical protein
VIVWSIKNPFPSLKVYIRECEDAHYCMGPTV